MRTAIVRVGTAPPLRVWIAETAAEQEQGLQGFPPLNDHQGMLFPERLYGWDPRFVMGSVSFPLDMLFFWNGVLGAIRTVEPGDPHVYSFNGVTSVLEVPGGWARRYGVERGAPLLATL